MTILIDGDSCPRLLLPVIDRACHRLEVPALFVANRALPLPSSPWFTFRLCSSEEEAADNALVELSQPHDLAITRDTILARRLLALGVVVISPHGHQFTADNVGQRASEAQALQGLRSHGLIANSPVSRNYNQRQQFAAVFDRCLARLCRQAKVSARENPNTPSY